MKNSTSGSRSLNKAAPGTSPTVAVPIKENLHFSSRSCFNLMICVLPPFLPHYQFLDPTLNQKTQLQEKLSAPAITNYTSQVSNKCDFFNYKIAKLSNWSLKTETIPISKKKQIRTKPESNPSLICPYQQPYGALIIHDNNLYYVIKG